MCAFSSSYVQIFSYDGIWLKIQCDYWNWIIYRKIPPMKCRKWIPSSRFKIEKYVVRWLGRVRVIKMQRIKKVFPEQIKWWACHEKGIKFSVVISWNAQHYPQYYSRYVWLHRSRTAFSHITFQFHVSTITFKFVCAIHAFFFSSLLVLIFFLAHNFTVAAVMCRHQKSWMKFILLFGCVTNECVNYMHMLHFHTADCMRVFSTLTHSTSALIQHNWLTKVNGRKFRKGTLHHTNNKEWQRRLHWI